MESFCMQCTVRVNLEKDKMCFMTITSYWSIRMIEMWLDLKT